MIGSLAVLEPIERPLTAILEWLHATGGLSWGLAIVVLTLMVRIVIVPLTVRQIHSMQKLQQFAPELKAIQTKYKNDRQRMNEEVMKFYRENKVNPAASCFPILIQIPVFISLFYVLKGFERDVLPKYPQSDLGFLVVPNITDKINSHWSGYLLLVLYVGSQVASTVFMSTTMDPKQRWLFMAMPFFFVFFIINFPMGLMIYWVTTNLWTVGQGLVTRRLVPKPPPAPPKRSSRAEPPPPSPPKDGDGAKPRKPSGGEPPQRVRRRKKRGPQARR